MGTLRIFITSKNDKKKRKQTQQDYKTDITSIGIKTT